MKLQARLNSWLEGYELYGINDQVAAVTSTETAQSRSRLTSWAPHSRWRYRMGGPAGFETSEQQITTQQQHGPSILKP